MLYTKEVPYVYAKDRTS